MESEEVKQREETHTHTHTHVIQKSMRLKYEPASEPLHIYVKQLFSN